MKLRGQAGFTLIEAVFILMLTLIVFTTLAPHGVTQSRENVSLAYADALSRADQIVSGWAQRKIGEMVRSNTNEIKTDVDIIAKELGISSYGVSSLPKGLSLIVTASLAPAGCSENCGLEWLIFTSGSVLDINGLSNTGVSTLALKALGGRGAVSSPETPSLLRSSGGRWSVMNPVGAVPNVLAVRGAYTADPVAQGIRLDGTQQLSSDWNVGKKTLSSIENTTTNHVGIADDAAAKIGQPCSIPYEIVTGGDKSTLTCISGIWAETSKPPVTNVTVVYE